MKFHPLCLFLFVGILVSLAVFAETGKLEDSHPNTTKDTATPMPAETGDIDGHVSSQTTGEPLANADVRIIEIDVSQKTDAFGNFQFIDIIPGTYTVSVTHAKHQVPTTTTIKVTAGDTTQAKIYLGESIRLETVIVEGKRLSPTVSRKEIRGSELLRIPGTASDALRGLMTLPGIGVPNDFFGILYIRGSGPGDTIFYLDRTPLGYPFHFGGIVSTLNSNIIEDIHVYAGGYGAQFGLDSQTVLDIHSSKQLDEKRLSGKFNLNALYSDGMLEGKIGDKGYVYATGRRSYFDLIAAQFIDGGVLPYFSDYQFKLNYELSGKHQLMVNAFGAVDHFDLTNPNIEERDPPNESGTYFKNGFEAQGIHLRSLFTEKFISNLSLTRSFNFLNINFLELAQEFYELDADGKRQITSQEYQHYNIKVNVPIYTLREDIEYQLAPAFQLESGFLFALSPALSLEDGKFLNELEGAGDSEDEEDAGLFDEEEEVPQFPEAEKSLKINNFETVYDEFEYDFQRAEGYLQGRYELSPSLSVALGARLDYLNLTEQLSIQPRGSLSLELPNTSTLRFAYGRYEQSPLAYQVLADDGNPNLKPSVAQHYILEFEHELSPETELKFATYYKDIQNLITPDEKANYLNQGAGFVGGAEAFFRFRLSEKFFGWLSYSWTHGERRLHPDDPYEPYLFDNTHIVSIVYNTSITPTFEIGTKWQYSSGTSATPVSEIFLIQDATTSGMQPLFGNLQDAESEGQPLAELPAYHRLDVRISKTWNVKSYQIGTFLEVLNVYNQKNTIRGVNAISGEVQETNQFPIIPYVGLTVEF